MYQPGTSQNSRIIVRLYLQASRIRFPRPLSDAAASLMILTTTPQRLVTTHTPHTYLPCTARGTRTPILRRMLHPRPHMSVLMVAVVWFATYRPPIPGARSTHGTATGLHGPESSQGRSRPAIKTAVDGLGMMHHLGNNNLLTVHMVDFEHSPRGAGTFTMYRDISRPQPSCN